MVVGLLSRGWRFYSQVDNVIILLPLPTEQHEMDKESPQRFHGPGILYDKRSHPGSHILSVQCRLP
ncbi:hypothetical protein GUITHDRAFT_151090 [Guillardia theta CCMP2712]|uniref:Uncharacterized protein n=1 Tax=Guillardia theta (strain CCMP2712) TaxID=905079 RepID=L1JQM0_GUITC|nr:hypothetical protein GUITHDRAFT_151090 [Guillardia theta CCMP2712]EKX50851.1 hypothetical protein GUITHDRAFT_151090 [Guillardia theta CCMP2712]|eukprot:XP_005837831.1 hypothetical protein GUITHDRAFT_151090 [Guillardia theta CCMP2712]